MAKHEQKSKKSQWNEPNTAGFAVRLSALAMGRLAATGVVLNDTTDVTTWYKYNLKFFKLN